MTASAYILHDPTDVDRHFWLIKSSERVVTWEVDGQELEPIESRNGYPGPWFIGPASGTPVGHKSDTSRVIGYRLRDADAVSAKFPATLTPAEWSTRTATYDDTADSPEYALYDRITEKIPGELVQVDQIIDLGDGSPAPQDGLTWTAQLPYELQHHPELLHRFPGRLTGFRAAVIDALKRLPFMAPGFAQSAARESDGRPGCVDVYTHVAYEPRRTRFVHDTDRRGNKLKRGRDVVETTRLEVSVRVPATIEGPDRATAVETWHRTMAEIIAEVTEALTPAPCAHCKGTGIVSRAADGA